MRNFIIIISFFFTSCISQREIMLSVLKPAELPINEYAHTVLIINSNPVLYLADVTGDKFEQEVKDSMFVNIHRTLSQYYLVRYKRMDNESIDEKKAEELCIEYDADLMIDLKKFSIVPQETTCLMGVEETSDYDPVEKIGHGSIVADVNHYFFNEVKSRWVLYDKKAKKYFKINSSMNRNESINKVEDIIWMSKLAGFAIEKITGPTFDLESRRLYITENNSDMLQSSLYINHGKWDAAAEIWKSCINDPDRKVRYASCHNLGIYYEKTGSLADADKYYNEEKKNKLMCFK